MPPMPNPDDPTGLVAEAARHRGLRSTLEGGVVAEATSIDGHAFHFQSPVGMPLAIGGYVTLETAQGRVLGQVTDFDLSLEEGPEVAGAAAGVTYRTRVRYGRGEGRGIVLDEGTPFHDAPLRPAEPAEIAAWLERCARPRARLEVGEALHAPGVPVQLDGGGFDRHTFLCGQSGSGKSYALGLVLERLLLETDLRILVLDPNSDCVRLPVLRDGADPGLAARWGDLAPGIAVHRAGGGGGRDLHLRFFDLDVRLKAAVAGLDPVRDRWEYGALLDVVEEQAAGRAAEDLLASLTTGPDDARALAARIRNLGLLEWSIWTGERRDPGVIEALDGDDWRCMVVDLGSVASSRERAVVAAALLERLWQRRAERRPVLVVMDEAHNVCPAEPDDALGRITTDAVVRIAAEGRKYGIHLLAATQRPSRVHQGVVSQCDNLVLMRMNSAGDVASLAGTFSFVPPSVLARATSFRLGESLVAGRIAPHPLLLRFGARVAQEGGGDPAADWARPR